MLIKNMWDLVHWMVKKLFQMVMDMEDSKINGIMEISKKANLMERVQ